MNEKLYNEGIKKRFINWYIKEKQTSEYYIRRVFSMTAPFEKMYGHDLFDFNATEIANMYQTMLFKTYGVLLNYHSIWRNYVTWSIQQNMVKDNINHFYDGAFELATGALAKFIPSFFLEKNVITDEVLREWEDSCPNMVDAFLLRALYEGIKGKDYVELLKLELKDIDTKNNIAHLCTGRTVKVSNRLIDLAKEADLEQEYYPVVPDDDSATLRKTYPYKKDETTIFKNYPNAQDDADIFTQGRRIQARIKRMFAYLGVNRMMSVSLLQVSGEIDFINKAATNLNISGEDFINNAECLNKVALQFGKKSMRKQNFLPFYKNQLVV